MYKDIRDCETHCDSLKDKRLEDDILKISRHESIVRKAEPIITKCCGGKRVWHKSEFVCSSCGMPYTIKMHDSEKA